MDKNSLREYVKKQRDMLSQTERMAYSETIMEKIINLKSFENANTIMCFASFGSEVDTYPLLREIIVKGKLLVLPRVEKQNNEKVLGLYKVASLEKQLVKGVFGIMEPDPKECDRAYLSEIELCICPGVVFDRKRNRIGYGGGFYDKLLKADLIKFPKIAIAFDIQVTDAIEPDPFDIPMDKVITETGEY
jgi:5,10-methenyltetrahydrofolate synthetase